MHTTKNIELLNDVIGDGNTVQTYSILCEVCGDILQDGTTGAIAAYAVTHNTECPGPRGNHE